MEKKWRWVIISFIFILTAIPSIEADTTNLTKAEEAGVRLLFLANSGYVKMEEQSSFVFISVEKKLWNSMIHQEKKSFCNMTALYYQELFKKKGKEFPLTLIFSNMTTREKIATANVFTKRIDVNIKH